MVEKSLAVFIANVPRAVLSGTGHRYGSANQSLDSNTLQNLACPSAGDRAPPVHGCEWAALFYPVHPGDATRRPLENVDSSVPNLNDGDANAPEVPRFCLATPIRGMCELLAYIHFAGNLIGLEIWALMQLQLLGPRHVA